MKMNKLLAMLTASTLFAMVPASASDLLTFDDDCLPHIMHRAEKVSRDYTYLEFYRNTGPCRFQGVIGGEHQTFINVIGFSGDRYSVSLIDKKNETSFSISGDEIKVSRQKSENEQIIEIEAMQTFFSISPSAYPYGEYQITIKKLSD